MTASTGRHETLTGIAFAVLAVGGNLLQGSVPAPHGAPREAVQFYLGESTNIAAGMAVALLGVVALLWFLGVLRDRLAVMEAGTGRLATTAFGGGIVGASLLAAGLAVNAVGALRARSQDEIAPELAAALFDGSFVLMGMASAAGFAVCMLATAVVVLRARTLPRWFGGLSVLLAIPGLVAPVAWTLLLLFPLWTAIAATLLWRAPVGAANRS